MLASYIVFMVFIVMFSIFWTVCKGTCASHIYTVHTPNYSICQHFKFSFLFSCPLVILAPVYLIHIHMIWNFLIPYLPLPPMQHITNHYL